MSDEFITTKPGPRQALSLVAGRRVEVDGVGLWVTDSGRGAPALVCLHAAGHGSRDFEPLVMRGKSEFRIITVDWPSHGNSDADRTDPDAARYADLIEGLLDALGLARCVLLGCSVGGAAATLVAARLPHRIDALILCNSGGFATPGLFVRSFTRFMAGMYRRGSSGAWWYPWAFGVIYRLLLRGPNAAEQRARIIAAGDEHAMVLSQLWASFGEPVNDVRRAAQQVRCPVWLAWARSDPFNNHRMIGRGLAPLNGKLSLFEGGHAPFLEQPDAFFEQLGAFLSALPDPVRVQLHSAEQG